MLISPGLKFNPQKMNCPNCNSKLKKVKVSIEDASTKAVSYQCPNCDYYTFDPKSSVQVIREIKRELC